jgi:chromosome partitioning protein
VGSTVDIAQETGRPFAFAVTQAKPTARLTVQAVAALSAHGAVAPAIVHDRVDYAASMVDGRTVQETDPRGRSAQEIAELFVFVQARINEKTKARKKEII